MITFYRDVSNSGTGFVNNLDSVQQGLVNLLSTRIGERVNRPWLGCDIDDGLFELIDEEVAAILQQRIYECLVQEQRINVHSVVVDPDIENEGYSIHIVYSVVGLGDKKFELAGTLRKE